MRSTNIDCKSHGKSEAARVCRHLVMEPVQQWFGDYPSDAVKFPDAWCILCNETYVRDGGWKKKSALNAGFRKSCQTCYLLARARSVTYLQGAELDKFNEFVTTCYKELETKQEKLASDFGFTAVTHPEYDQGTGILMLSDEARKPIMITDFQFIGSVANGTQTWLWAWANFSTEKRLRTRVVEVRDFGEKMNYPRLTTAKWTADDNDGWKMAAIATHIMQIRGVYSVQWNNISTFVAILNPRLPL